MYQGKRIGAIVAARMASTRLPGKVMLSLRGKPSLQWIIERLRNSKYLDNTIVATVSSPSCDPIVNLCHRLDCNYYRGSEDDVLSRYIETAHAFAFDVCVRITGDCPMVDPAIVDRLISMFFQSECDFCSNSIERTFPRGFDVEVVSTETLDKINLLAEGVDRQHVVTYIYESHPEDFTLKNWVAPKELFHPELRVTLDTLEDYVLIHTLYETLDLGFTALDVVTTMIANPELQQINADIKQKHYEEG